MVGKMPNVTWPEGSFAETVKGWKSGWFYITDPRDTNWVAAPEFRSGVPMRLTSWQEKGLTWGSSNKITGLQTCVQNMITVGDITTGVTRPGGAGLRHDDNPMKPNNKLEDGGSVMGLRPRGGLRPVVINRR